jgi:hypothetical protein
MFGFSDVPQVHSPRLFGPRLRFASPPPNAFHAHDTFAHYGEMEVYSEEAVARELELKRRYSVHQAPLRQVA